MNTFLETFRSFNLLSVAFRLLLAMVCGGIVGYGRAKRKRAAGLRTYTLITIGATLTVLLAIYEYEMLCGPWADVVAEIGMKYDAARYSAQVISGIGFLGAGTILTTSHQQVSGLTTATGLFTAVCMGMAIGVGYYELVLIVVLTLSLVMNIMAPLEAAFKRRARNINVYVEFNSVEDLSEIAEVVRRADAQLFEIDIERTKMEGGQHPGAVLSIKMAKGHASHSDMLSSIAELNCVRAIRELIS